MLRAQPVGAFAPVIFEHAGLHPDAIALDDLVRQRTWAELCDRATRVARLLRDDLGLRPDDHAALLMGNRVEHVELVLGAVLAGIWLTPLNWHLTTDEIAYILEDSGARVLFTDWEQESAARSAAASHTRVLVAGDELDAALASASGEPMPADGPSGSTMIDPSGTTGRPKGVQRVRAATIAAALENGAATGRSIGLDGHGPHLVTGPLYHAAPLWFGVYDLMAGAPMVIMHRWDERAALALIEQRRIAHTHLVPTMFVRLLRLPEDERREFDASSLTLVLHGAAPIAPHVKRAMIEWWGHVIVEYWGATEGGVCTLVDSAEWLAHPGTVGRATPNFEVFAVDADGRRLACGEIGTLYCRHHRVSEIFRYHRAPEKTAAAYLGEGAFTTGDVGYVDADGYVFLCDRQANMIISGGVNIYPAEVEQVLQRHPAVADVAVFGIPDDEWGESVKAAVELREGLAAGADLEAEILAFAREHLAAYKVPRSIDFEEKLPRHTTGKLYTRLLRDRYWTGRERSI